MNNYSQLCSQVLLVDDEEEILATSKLALQIGGIRDIATLSDSREVLPYLADHQVAVMVLDLSMPHVSGLEILAAVTRDYTHIPTIVLSANDDITTVVACMKLGALDYLAKPVSPARLLTAVRKDLELSRLESELFSLKHHLLSGRLDQPSVFAAIVTGNRKMRSLFQYLEVIAGSRQPIIVTGETGVGKELMARAIHELSGCRGEFIALNVAGLDDLMFSDILFGHKKGAFSGADQPREGLIARAAGGTLFLDEIGDLNEVSQRKLLRLLQEREYYPLGSDLIRKSDAHFVLATNRDLQQRIAEGSFRNDLYYRLCGHQVQVPPLRERKDDLALLLEHFIRQEAELLGIAPPGYPKELIDLLESYHFPGNVRELQGMVSDAVPRGKHGMLSLEPFRQAISSETRAPLPAALLADDVSLQNKLEEVWGHFPTLHEAEDLLINSALQAAKGNQGIAASMLGLKRQTLNVRLRVKRGAY
jgi:two-component system, NtrC family, response regulator HydG